jgi:hypothetical protein
VSTVWSVDPEILKVMTDPEARKDPERMRALSAAMTRNARKTVIEAARTNSVVMSVVGSLMIAAGIVLLALFTVGIAIPNLRTIPSEVLWAAPLVGLMGSAFVFFGSWTAMPSKRLLTSGSTARATVHEVKALGRTIGIRKPGIQASLSRVTVFLAVTPDAGAPFEALHSEFITGGDLRHLQVGASIPVRFDSRNPSRLAIDWDAI